MRDSLPGRLGILLVVLILAALVARSCGDNSPDVSSKEAIEIAKQAITFVPEGVQVKNVPRSLQQHRVWAVSLYTGTATAPRECRLVEVDTRSGDVLAVHGC